MTGVQTCALPIFHLDLTLVQGDRNGSICIPLHDNHQLCQHHLLKMLFFSPLDGFSSLVKDQVTIGVWVHFWVFNSIPLVYLSVSQRKKDSIFNNWCWHNWLLSCRRMRIDPYLSPCTKVKSKWIKELHIKPETLKLIEEKVGKSLEDMGTGEKFLNRTAMACSVRSRIDKWDLKNCKASARQKTPSIRQKGHQEIGKGSLPILNQIGD